jgi:pimeloyl-ACP methyl ester carboxylesterase
MKTLLCVLTTALCIALTSFAYGAVTNVVLVHGAFVDGSGWKPVANILQRDGYTVYVVQEPETSLEADVAATRLVLDRAGPCVLVGHSYGGVLITEAGGHPAVKSLVYVAAFQPAPGESAASLEDREPGLGVKSIVQVGDGYLQVDPKRFHEDFAADLPKSSVQFTAVSQVPITLAAFQGKVTESAWATKPSYAIVAKQDRMINPDNERFMTRRAKSETIELPGSHSVYVSRPKEVAALIERAAKSAE